MQLMFGVSGKMQSDIDIFRLYMIPAILILVVELFIAIYLRVVKVD